jgi:RHH-type transcriptional regulator, rel operon repressor / antitoxin RelB
MLNVRLPKEIEDRLEALAVRTGRSKSYYARRAITEFLEDQEDYLLAVAALEEAKERFTLAEAAAKLELEG